MKKVGLVTYYGENYGGVLQAYALQRYVKQLGLECRIISNDFLYTAKTGKAELFHKVMVLLKNPVDYLKRRYQMRKFASERAAKSEKFRQFNAQYLEIDQLGYDCYAQYEELPPSYDVYLCGSDQIWNPNLYHDNGFYFAGFAPENAKIVAYASSIGVSSVTEEQALFMKPFLNRIHTISTREKEGSLIAEKITGRPVRTVIDPTLLLNDQQWSEIAAPRMIDEPYVFCYFFGERDYYQRIKDQIRKTTGLKLVSIPYVARELADRDEKIFDAGPAEFVSLIKHANLVLTDSFHATAFSINFGTPFVTLSRFAKNDPKGMNSRLNTVLQAVGLEERFLDETDEICEEALLRVDFESAQKKLEMLRCADGTFLKNALEKGI